MSRRRVSRFPDVSRSFVAFMMIAAFGILFAGCSPVPETPLSDSSTLGNDQYSFTAEDLERFQRLAEGMTTGTAGASGAVALAVSSVSGSVAAVSTSVSSTIAVSTDSAASVPATPLALDVSLRESFKGLRTGGNSAAENGGYAVTNDILKLRSSPSTAGQLLRTLKRGDALSLLEFANGEWAKVKTADGLEGFVSTQYISKFVTSDELAAENKVHENSYYVDYAFLNVRAAPDAKSDKIDQIPGLAFVRPLSRDGEWVKVQTSKGVGYVSTTYLKKFSPNLVVRTVGFVIPVLQYSASDPTRLSLLAEHVRGLKAAGFEVLALIDMYQKLLAMEKGAAPPAKAVVVTVTDVTPANVKLVSDSLGSQAIRATVFLRGRDLGISGITQKTVLTLLANGLDVQSAGFTGDDLRSLTDPQLKLEVEQSRALLEQQTGRPVLAIDYPQGGLNDRVIAATETAGYLFGVTNSPKASYQRSEFLKLPSIPVTQGMSAEDIVRLVE